MSYEEIMMQNNKYFQKFKEKLSEATYYERVNIDELIQIPVTMFKYGNVPEEMQEYWELFEEWLCKYSCVAIGKHKGKLIFVNGGLGGGKLNEYGFMTEFIGATRNGESIRWTVGKDCTVFWNNVNKTPDLNIFKYADLLSDIDVSLDDNLLYSRFYPVPLVDDERQKKQVESFFTALKRGGKKTTVFDKKKDVASIVNGTESQIPVLNLTDVKNSDKIQYLSHFRDDVKRWFTTYYGQAVQGTGKQAQQSIEEIDGNTSVSFIYPLNKLMCRRKAIDALNKLFNLNMTVDFNPAWGIEYEKFEQSAEMPEEEIEADTIEPETTAEPAEIIEEIAEEVAEVAAEIIEGGAENGTDNSEN